MCKWSIQILKEKQMKDSPICLLAFFLKERWRKLKFCFFNFIRHFLVHVWQYVSASTIVFCRWNLSFLHFLIWFNFLHLSWSDRHVSSHFWQISFFFRLILPQIPSFPAQRPPPLRSPCHSPPPPPPQAWLLHFSENWMMTHFELESNLIPGIKRKSRKWRNGCHDNCNGVAVQPRICCPTFIYWFSRFF